MADRIRHRGPDDSGLMVDSGSCFAVGHRRLSIIDLSEASHQPMVHLATGVVLAYNGEVYNFQELRTELMAAGHVFRSSGDTEVVLVAYLQWGIEFLERLCGMFALAIWDPRSRVLHLARDAMGMKPLYVYEYHNGVAFASEIKAFLALEYFDSRLDSFAVQQFLEFGYIFESHRTSLVAVSKIEPGERVEIFNGIVTVRHSWYRPPCPHSDDARAELERVEQLRSTLDQVVEQHLVADVPVGLLLSGGLDSSLLAALASRHGSLTTVSMGFDQSAVDERPHARLVAEHIGSRHIDVLISAADVRAEVESGAWVFDDLFADWGTVTSRLLYRRCRELGIKCVLVGEGADELFGGYDVFRQPKALGLLERFRIYQRYAGRRFGRLFVFFDRILREYLDYSEGDPFEAIRLFESRRQLPNQYVMKVDKASMAESIEARAPYLDSRVAGIAYRTPRHWLLRNAENKHLLRCVARAPGLLPAETAAREKFGAPLAASWMDDDPTFRGFVSERLLDRNSLTIELGYKRVMELYLKKGRKGDAWPRPLSIFRNLAWRLLLLELWRPHYVNR